MDEFKVGDFVLLKDTRVIATVYDISVPDLVRVKIGNGTLAFFEPQHLQKLPADPGCETRQSFPTPLNCAVTRIIHNGTTTITQFVDCTKMITRPSEDDASKYDPYVGWCVGVTAKLYGGKEKAKKFYKAHAVVQREVGSAPFKTLFESIADAIGTINKFSHAIKSDVPVPDWDAVRAEVAAVAKEQAEKEEQTEPEVILLSLKRKLYDDSVFKRHCYVCDGYHSLSNFAPCKGCWEAGNAGHHPNFTPKPFEE